MQSCNGASPPAAQRQAQRHHLKQLPPEKHTAQKMITLQAVGQREN